MHMLDHYLQLTLTSALKVPIRLLVIFADCFPTISKACDVHFPWTKLCTHVQ